MPNQEAKILLDVKMPGSTSFTLTDFYGVERLSSLFEYQLTLVTTSRTVNFETMMGNAVTVSMHVGSEKRTFSGIIGQFEQDDTPFNPLRVETVYRAMLYPSFWLLRFSGQCRAFQNESAIAIIQSVFTDHKLPHINKVQTAGKRSRDFCVQYNETDFDFVSRLMEEEGIFYYFEQMQTGHELVLADAPSVYASCPNAASASFHDSAVYEPLLGVVVSCFIKQRLGPNKMTLGSYNYLTPETPLSATAFGKTGTEGRDITQYKQIYEEKSQGESLAKVRLEEMEFPKKMVEGTSTNAFFLAGYKFDLKEHPRTDANISYAFYEVKHEAHLAPETSEHFYSNTFQAFSSSVPFRPPLITPKPRIYGTQTAKVTGKQGEEIYTDDYGRIKVKFRWDPSKKTDDSTSCWIRVGEECSGKGWGTLFTPRVGMEVIVSFIDGDPDNPIVIGSVYNGENKPPYLPKDKEIWTIKDHSSPNGTGFNEIRLKAKTGEEEVYVHAEKDFNIDIKHDLTMKVEEGMHSLNIIKGNYIIELGEGNITITCKSGNVTLKAKDVEMDCSGKFTVNAHAIALTAKTTLSLNGETGFSAETGGSSKISAGAASELTAGGSVKVSGGGSAELSGGASTKVSAGGITSITGALVKLNG